MVSYNTQLLWLEGASVAVARPQNLYNGHLRYTDDAPIFISTLESDLHTAPKSVQKGDVAMMLKRLKVFRFHTQLQSVVGTQAAYCQPCICDLQS